VGAAKIVATVTAIENQVKLIYLRYLINSKGISKHYILK